MENRSHALMAGIFTLVLLAAAALAAIWIGRDRTQLQPYEIISATAVSGLNPQSTVRYQGVPVGKVQSLALNPDKPGQVRIRIGIAPNTPITESTWAELGVQGVTGMSNVELRDDGTSMTRLVSSAAHPAAIPLRPGFLDRIEQRGGKLISNVEEVTEQLRRVLSEQNVQALTASLQNATDLTQSLKEASRDLGPTLAKLGPLVDSLNKTSSQADRAAREVGGLARSGVQRFHERPQLGHRRAEAAAGLFQRLREVGDVLQAGGQRLHVLFAQDAAHLLGDLLHVRDELVSALPEALEKARPQRDGGRVQRRGFQPLARSAIVAQLDVGHAGHALHAQFGPGRFGDRRVRRDADADAHLPRLVRVQRQRLHLAHGHALVAHGGLRIQAADGGGGDDFVWLQLGPVAADPDGRQRSGGQQDQRKDTGHERMTTVFHDAIPSAPCLPARAGRARPGRTYE